MPKRGDHRVQDGTAATAAKIALGFDKVNLADIPSSTQMLVAREQLETIALALARREREFTELAEHLDRQLASLAEMRGLLLRTLWPR